MKPGAGPGSLGRSHHADQRSGGIASVVLASGAGCSGSDGEADQTTPEQEPPYTVLLDDDTDPDQMKGKAGAYAMTARGDGRPPLAVVDVPADYTNFGYFAMSGGVSDPDADFFAVQYWTVYGVYEDPCGQATGAPEIGTSVEDLTEALAAQSISRVTAPRPVTLDGHEGLFVELRVPEHLDLETCGEGRYFVWHGKPGDAHHQLNAAGSRERLWILDVDGTRVVLAAISGPEVTADQASEIDSIVESVRFEPIT